MKRHELGLRGEELALAYLRDRGYTLVERNFRCRLGEVDLILKDGCELVFVEVKTRSSHLFGMPKEAVTPAKQARIRRLAQYYLLTRGRMDLTPRFDVVGVDLARRERPVIEHLVAAF